MTQEQNIVNMSVSVLDVEKSGLDAHTYIAGIARRKAVEAKKSLSMLEFSFNEQGKLWHAKVYLKEAPNAG